MATNDTSTIERLTGPRTPPESDRTPRTMRIDDADAGSVFDVLSSTTARDILSHLYEEAATASDLAERVDTSIQNVDYHLDRLDDAGLVREVDTWYSSRGVEMSVYAPASEPLVVLAVDGEDEAECREAVEVVAGGD